jgi:hypothetical protein
MRATHVALAGNTNTARAVACLLSCRPRSSRSSTTRPGPGTRSVPGSEAPPVARCWVSMDGDGEEPAPSRVWTPAFAPKSRSLGSVSWSCRTGLHTRNPTAWLRGCRRCKPTKCGNKTGRNRKYAWSRPTTVPTTVRRKTGSIRSIEARAVASPDSSTLLHQQWEWDFLGKQ